MISADTRPPLGQHFLKDPTILSSIVGLAGLTKDDHVLEIGPGQGDLTKLLTQKAGNVTVVELDKMLAKYLPKMVKADNLQIINQDILKFNLNELPKDYKVVANIPYYITSKLIRLLLEAENQPTHIILLIQKEVAQRLVANPGSMSILGISAQLYADILEGPIVSPESFTPPPKVDSQVVVIKPLAKPRLDVDTKKFMTLVKQAFAAKRKKLSNNLKAYDRSREALEELGLHNSRAQELSMSQWQELYNKLHN